MDNEEGIAALVAARQAAERVVEGMDEGPRKERVFDVAFQHFIAESGTPATEAVKPTRTRGRRKAGTRVASKARKAVSPSKLLEDLAAEGFFNTSQALPDIVDRLKTDGHTYRQEDLSKPLQRLTQSRVLRRQQREGGKGARRIYYYERHPGYSPE